MSDNQATPSSPNQLEAAVGSIGNLTVNTLTVKQWASVGGDAQAASLSGGSLEVGGVVIGTAGNVEIYGPRSTGQLTPSAPAFSATAPSDGVVVASIGTVDPQLKTEFAGLLLCTTRLNGQQTSVNYASASTRPMTVNSGKKGSVTLQIPQYGNLNVPVRQGEQWSLQLVAQSQFMPAPQVVFYWLPYGPDQAQQSLGEATLADVPQVTVPADLAQPGAAFTATQPLQSLADLGHAWQALQHNLQSGALTGHSVAAAQRVIDERAGDLTQILGDATGMSTDPAARAAFLRDLQRIVCKAAPPGTPLDNRLDPRDLDDLIATFAQVTGHALSADQRALLAAGVRALVAINDNEQSRQDLNLIRTNLSFFLDQLEQVVRQTAGLSFNTSQRRLLTRALVRIVGDGRRDPARVTHDHFAAEAFVNEVEQALTAPLDPAARQDLQATAEQVVQARPDPATAAAWVGTALAQAVANKLREGGQRLLQLAIDRLLVAAR